VTPEPEVALPPEQALDRARVLLAQGRPFAAHEVLEARWKDAPEHERDLWQGLAQLCVGLTHAARGNRAGAQRLLARGAERLERYAGSPGPRYGLEPGALAAWARQAVQADEPGALPL
jgi:predicted metal-dependent hydrolase